MMAGELVALFLVAALLGLGIYLLRREGKGK